MSAHRATLDYAARPLRVAAEENRRGRHDANRLAEEQGSLGRRWLMSQTTLDVQVDASGPSKASRVSSSLGKSHQGAAKTSVVVVGIRLASWRST